MRCRGVGLAGLALVALTGGCGGAGVEAGAPPAPAAPARAANAAPPGDTGEVGLVPAGYGSLRQEDISVRVRLPLVLVRLTPLDESIIRLLSPDSYRALRGLRDGQRAAIARSAARLGIQQPSLWYISFFGLQPDARFTARDVDILSSGRDFRPLDVIPLTSGFGEERVAQREVQSAIYLFDDGLELGHPLTITVNGVPTTSWSAVLPVIERERALVRSRAARP